MQPRQVAFIVRINDINKGSFVKEDGWNPSYVKIGNKNISRVNIIGAVIESRAEKNFQNIIIDDGTGKISVRNFDKKIDAEIGDVVLLVGRMRQFGNDKYVVPEIINKKVDMKWSAVWKKNAVKEDRSKEESGDAEEKTVFTDKKTEYTSNDIVSKIRDLDDGTGVSYDDVVRNTEDEKIISGLLLRGDVFEIKPGKLKVLD